MARSANSKADAGDRMFVRCIEALIADSAIFRTATSTIETFSAKIT
jgi:hypothetical protein